MKRSVKILRGALAALRWLAVALCILLCVFVIYLMVQKYVLGNEMPTFFGYTGAGILSGSMDDGSDDAIRRGDFVIIHAQGGYELGDVVTYLDSDGSFVTHRVVSITEGGYITQGDREGSALDDMITDGDIVGKVVGVVPGMGDFIEFMRTIPGMLAVLTIGVVIWFTEDIVGIVIQRRRDKKTLAEQAGPAEKEASEQKTPSEKQSDSKEENAANDSRP